MEGQSRSTTVPPFPKEFKGEPLLIFYNGGFAYINPNLFHDFLAQDVDTVQANILAVVQKPGNISGIANEKSGPPAWKQFRHGIRCLKMTTLSLLLWNICSQNK
jgi:hypothetical protein